jgi:Arc/MetJ-type ribon-helix-helix transcriptional regulator
VSRSIHVRLDDSSAAALSIVRSGELSDSEAVRTALRESAARRRTRSAIAEEVQRLAADAGDRAAVARVMADMDAVAADWPE